MKKIHRRYDDRKDRPDLRSLALCNHLGNWRADKSQLSSDPAKVTCGSCLRIMNPKWKNPPTPALGPSPADILLPKQTLKLLMVVERVIEDLRPFGCERDMTLEEWSDIIWALIEAACKTRGLRTPNSLDDWRWPGFAANQGNDK